MRSKVTRLESRGMRLLSSLFLPYTPVAITCHILHINTVNCIICVLVVWIHVLWSLETERDKNKSNPIRAYIFFKERFWQYGIAQCYPNLLVDWNGGRWGRTLQKQIIRPSFGNFGSVDGAWEKLLNKPPGECFLREVWEKLWWWNEAGALGIYTVLALPFTSCVILSKSLNFLGISRYNNTYHWRCWERIKCEQVCETPSCPPPPPPTVLPLSLLSAERTELPAQFWPPWVCSRTSFCRNST